MRLKFVLSLTFCLVALPAFPQQPTYSQLLATALENHIVVLRNYYTAANLAFDSDGQLTSHSAVGFGPSEGQVYVQAVHLADGKLRIEGQRPVEIFDSTKKDWHPTDLGAPVSIEVQLPGGELAERSVPRLLQSIFLPAAEVAKLQCSPAETRALGDGTLLRSERDLPAITSVDQLQSFCFPGGDRAYRVTAGITPPRAKKTPDPEYTEAARLARIEGKTTLLLIITPSGSTAAMAVARSIGSTLDNHSRALAYQLDRRAVETVSQWQFDPARLGNTPIPVVIEVEVSFRVVGH